MPSVNLKRKNFLKEFLSARSAGTETGSRESSVGNGLGYWPGSLGIVGRLLAEAKDISPLVRL
jgi:hypothetical protein